MNKKTLFQKNLIYFQYSKSFEDINPKISYQIKNYGFQNVFKGFQANKNLLSEIEKQEFSKVIQEIKVFKEKLGKIKNNFRARC